MPLARMQQPPMAVTSTDATLKSVSELISTGTRSHLTGSTSPPSVMSASSSNSSSSMASVSSPPSSVSPDVILSSVQASSSTPQNSAAAVAAAAAAAAAASSQMLSPEMINPLRELNNYLARVEEEKCSLRDENEKLNDMREKLNMDLVTYSRFNCILECMKRSLKNALGAIECIDQNKACRCNEHLNNNLRQIVQDSKVEISLWQQKYEALVYKFHAEYESFHRIGSIISMEDNPLRHMNAALMGHNGALLNIPEANERNGFRETNGVENNNNNNNNHSNNATPTPSINTTTMKLTNGSAESTAAVDKSRAVTVTSPVMNGSGKPKQESTSGSEVTSPAGTSENGGNGVAHKNSLDLSTAINFSAASFMNDANNNTPKPRVKDDDGECHTPPPLIPAPPPPTTPQELISLDLAKRISSGDLPGLWRLNKYIKQETAPESKPLSLSVSSQSVKKSESDKVDERHYKHDVSDDEDDKFKCDWPGCDQLLDSEEILTQHRRCHIRKSNYQCRHCSARMLNREELDSHEMKCAKSERKMSVGQKSNNRASPDAEHANISKRKHDLIENDESSFGSDHSCSPKMVIDERRSKVDSGHSSEEEIEVEEIAKFTRPESSSADRILLNQLNRSGRESPKSPGHLLGSLNSLDARRVEAVEALDLVRYSDLLYPNKRQKAFTISTPSPYIPAQHLASSLSAFYPHLGQGAAGSLGHPLLSSGAGQPSAMDLAALVESGRISPLTLSMLAQQQQNQQRFQHYFAAAAQHHLQQQQQSSQPAGTPGSPPIPPPLSQSPGTVENLSVRSSSFSTANSPFYHPRTSSMSGLMAPPSGTSSSSSKPALSPVSQSSNERDRGSPSGLGFGHTTSPMFSPPASGMAGRSYTISTPNSFSALAALAAAATSTAVNNNQSSANGMPKTSVVESFSHQQKSRGFSSAFDLHSLRNGIGAPSPLGSPPCSGAPNSNNGRLGYYGQPPSGQSVGLPPHQPSVITPSPHQLLSGSSAQGLMIAAAAAAAADARHHPNHPVNSASDASRLTAAALASIGALKHHPGNGVAPVGEYKRTRYSGIGRYRCPWPDCGYTPHFLRDLRRHMFKHTGDKKHKCDYPGCDFVSVWKTSLLQHQRKKHYGVSAAIPLRSNGHVGSGQSSRPPTSENGTVIAGAM